MTASTQRVSSFNRGTVAMIPLSIAVIPWGILTGALAIDAGISPLAAQGLSLFIFAGAAQLATIGLVKAGAGLLTIIATTAIITLRHLLYSLTMRERIVPLSTRWRTALGFLLTDELFAVEESKQAAFNRWHAFGAGLSFYLVWNISTAIGISFGSSIPSLDKLGLEFAIAAIFIAMVVPAIKDRATWLAVITALGCSVLLSVWHVPGALIVSGLIGMFTAYGFELFSGRSS